MVWWSCYILCNSEISEEREIDRDREREGDGKKLGDSWVGNFLYKVRRGVIKR